MSICEKLTAQNKDKYGPGFSEEMANFPKSRIATIGYENKYSMAYSEHFREPDFFLRGNKHETSYFMLATPFSDKNGNQLYDADLIIVEDKYGPYLVWFDNAKGAWCSCAYGDADLISSYRSFEIVGNPFENPEIECEGEQFNL